MVNDVSFQDTGQVNRQAENEAPEAQESLEPRPVKLDNGFQGYYIDSNGDKQYFRHGKVKKEKKIKVKDLRPVLEQRTSLEKKPKKKAKARLPPSDTLAIANPKPFDLRSGRTEITRKMERIFFRWNSISTSDQKHLHP